MTLPLHLVQGARWQLDHPLAWCAVIASYLLGSVPFGLILARVFGKIDLRQFGSGNIGAANVARAMGRKWGIATFGCDALKGFVPVFVFGPLSVGARLGFVQTETVGWVQLLCGTAAVLGHCYPLYLRFRGGKAVATGCGAIIAVDPVIFLCGGAVWLLVLGATRYVGLASVMMGIAFSAAAVWRLGMERWEIVLGVVLLSVLIVVRHRSNFHRMLTGTEPRAGEKVTLSNSPRPHG